jgi:hypothetical protein
MTRAIAVVCEAPADRETACGLADRILCAEVEWIDAESLDDYRRWRGLTDNLPHLSWQDVPELARQARFRPHGHYAGQPGANETALVWKALALLNRPANKPEAILLIRDDDRDIERRRGFDQARIDARLDIPVIVGLAHTKRECWVLAGFDPRDEDETRRHEELRRELGFDPRTHAEGLTARRDHHKLSAKRVLAALTGDNRDREVECWLRCDLGILATRGADTGLTMYLQEIRERLVPLFTGQRSPPGRG